MRTVTIEREPGTGRVTRLSACGAISGPLTVTINAVDDLVLLTGLTEREKVEILRLLTSDENQEC